VIKRDDEGPASFYSLKIKKTKKITPIGGNYE
jgi:hypothetical protein